MALVGEPSVEDALDTVGTASAAGIAFLRKVPGAVLVRTGRAGGDGVGAVARLA